MTLKYSRLVTPTRTLMCYRAVIIQSLAELFLYNKINSQVLSKIYCYEYFLQLKFYFTNRSMALFPLFMLETLGRFEYQVCKHIENGFKALIFLLKKRKHHHTKGDK